MPSTPRFAHNRHRRTARSLRGGSATHRRSEVVGLPALGQDGRRAGSVGDLLFSRRGDRVIGLLLRGGTWWRRRLVPYEEVAAIGSAAVMLRAPVVLGAREGPRLGRLRRSHNPVVGLRVLSADGADLGIVEDVCFRSEGGAITGYLVSRGLVADVALGKGFLPLAAVRRSQAPRGENPGALRTGPVGSDAGGFLLVPPV